jgi:hypothetical protein
VSRWAECLARSRSSPSGGDVTRRNGAHGNAENRTHSRWVDCSFPDRLVPVWSESKDYRCEDMKKSWWVKRQHRCHKINIDSNLQKSRSVPPEKTTYRSARKCIWRYRF